jgi:cytochrome c-type biogenesis protein CcmH
MKRLVMVALLLFGLVGLASAAIDAYDFKSDAERERFRVLTEQLRCPKCQNQNIADSNAPIAADLRKEILRMMDDGKSDAEIVDFLVARYGDFVRYKPPLEGRTLLLWYGPWLLLGVGLVGLGAIVVRRRRLERKPHEVRLSADEQARLASLLTSENLRDSHHR